MYKIALTQVIFDNSYNNVLRFSSLAEQKAYFKLDTLFSTLPDVNMPFGTFYMTRVPIRIDESLQNEALSYNYAIVKDLEQADVYYFYFVKNASYDAGNTQMLCDLELDIFNTYYIDTQFTPCLINRAHIDRWSEVTDGKVKFNTNSTSLLFEQESIRPQAKRLVKRKQFALTSDKIGGGGEMSYISQANLDFLDKHVKGWVYVYLNKSATTLLTGLKNLLVEKSNGASVVMPYYVLVYPLLDNTSQILVNMSTSPTTSGTQYRWSFDELQKYISQLAPYILDINISQENPFPNFTSFNSGDTIILAPTTDGVITTANMYQNTSATHFSYGEFTVIGKDQYSSGSVVFCLYQHETASDLLSEDTMNSRHFDIGTDYEFNVSDIITSAHDIKYNPKLLTEQYTEFKLSVGTGVPQIYDLLKMGDNDIRISWRTTLICGITRYYIGAYPNKFIEPEIDYTEEINKCIYNPETFKSFVGASVSQDTSMPYSENMLEQFLAQNKNFYMQRTYNMASQLAKGTIASIGGKTTQGAVANMGETLVGMLDTYVNSEFTLDNMNNAPEKYIAVDGNPITTMGVNDNMAYYEIWQVLQNELVISDNIMNKNGYTYNRIDNIKNVDNIRHYWNYVQAQLENLYSTKIMSNNAREKFKEVFARGVRFWNITDLVTNNTFDFNIHENYERRINNEL